MGVLADAGYDGFRVEAVARRVGVAKGTIYLDFPSKEELVLAAIKRAGEQLVEEVAEALAGVADPRERVITAVRAAARAMMERPDLAVAVECKPVQGPVTRGDEPCAALREKLEFLVGEANRAKGLTGAQEDLTAEALLGLLSRPVWRQFAAEASVEEALGRAGIAELAAGPF